MATAFSVAKISRLLSNNGSWRLLSFKSLYRYSTVADSLAQPHFLLDYLISSLQFSKEEAILSTKKLGDVRNFRRDPDLVVSFLLNLGLSKTQIKSMVAVEPKILSYNVDKTLAPKIQVLKDIGISGSDLVNVLMNYKSTLIKSHRHVVCIRNLIGNDDLVTKLITKRTNVLDSRVPNIIQVFLNNGFSSENVVRLILKIPPGCLGTAEFYRGIMDKVENDFGISRQSKMFFHGVAALSSISDSKIRLKFETFRSLGLSDATIYRIVGRFPYILLSSQDKIRKNWKFLVEELECPPEYLISTPCILNFSFEKRMKPRSEVIKVLKEKELLRKLSLTKALTLPDTKFIDAYLLPYKDQIPDVYDSFLKIVGSKKAGNP